MQMSVAYKEEDLQECRLNLLNSSEKNSKVVQKLVFVNLP
jgi:hypothetical protein